MYDITIFYDYADEFQLKRLKKLVRCKNRKPKEKIKCKKAFFNFNIDMINDVEAEEYYFVSHANYEELNRVHGGYIPPIDNPKLTHCIGVSQFSTDKINEYAELIGSKIKAKKCYNPLTLEKCKKPKLFITACRLDDEVKGGKRTQILIKEMDKYCEEHPEQHYLLLIFTNPCKVQIASKNVAIMPPRIDVRPFIAYADMLFQLSNDMETYGYSINEALGYGVPIVTTPLTILNELPITDNEHIVLDWDCSNVKEVVKQIFEKDIKQFSYKPPEDNWLDLLDKTKSNYEEKKNMKYLVEALPIFEEKNIKDNEVDRARKTGEQWIVEEERKDVLTGNNGYKGNAEYNNGVFVKVIEEVKEDFGIPKGGKTVKIPKINIEDIKEYTSETQNEPEESKEEIKQEKEIKETPKPKRRKKVLED